MANRSYYSDKKHVGRRFRRTNGIVVEVSDVRITGDWRLIPVECPPGKKGRPSWKWGPHVEILEELPEEPDNA